MILTDHHYFLNRGGEFNEALQKELLVSIYYSRDISYSLSTCNLVINNTNTRLPIFRRTSMGLKSVFGYEGDYSVMHCYS